MLKQLTAMVAKMGDLISCAESASGMGLETQAVGGKLPERAIVQAVAKNIEDLVVVLCTPQNAPLFLKYDAAKADANADISGDGNGDLSMIQEVNAGDEAGPMATLITSCAATLPLQSPSYVGLTLAVEENAPGAGEETKGVSYKGFAQRCVTMASRRLADDLDKTCGVVSLLSKEKSTNDGDQHASNDEFVHAFMRSKLLLRYFALLSRIGIISGIENGDDSIGSGADFSSLSLAGILQAMIECASRAKNRNDETKSAETSFTNVSVLLAALVLSTIPYAVHVLSKDFVDGILSKIDDIVGGYKSPFTPGEGIVSILLKKAQFEEFSVDDDDDEESDDEDEDDDEDNDGSPVCADTFQDLIRSVRQLVESFYGNNVMPSRFALLSDAPWSVLEGKNGTFAPMEGASQLLTYSGEQLRISIPNCQVFCFLLGDNVEMEGLRTTLLRPNTEGVIFGRLSIFDPPPDDEDEGDEEGIRDVNVNAYVKSYSMLDRFFLSDSIRDCLSCHRATVSATGVERGSAKDAAEQIWAVSQLFLDSKSEMESTDNKPDSSKGVECGIVETILSLIVQCSRSIDTASPMNQIYLCRVLIELAKYQPMRIPQSLAFAVSILFNDFIPSFSPVATANLSQWFSYHLTNTDYQWPHSYWNTWAPFVVDGMKDKRNSRGEFVSRTLETMASVVASPKTIITDCLPVQSTLSSFVVCRNLFDPSNRSSTFMMAIGSVEKDIKERIWKNNDEPEDVQDYIVGEEVSEIIQGSMDEDIEGNSTEDSDKIWWRAGLITRAVLSPANELELKLRSIVQEQIAMEDETEDEDPKADIVSDITDFLSRYKSVLLAAMAKDIQIHDENLDLRGVSKKSEREMVLTGEVYILMQCQKVTGFSPVILSTCVEVLVKQKVVSADGVLQWMLGGEDQKIIEALASHGWWNLASTAIRHAMDDFVSDRIALMESDGGDISMIIDTGVDDEGGNVGTPSARRMKKVIDFVSPLLEYASGRVHALCVHSKNPQKLSHHEVDLKEGLKYLFRSITSHTNSTLKEDDTVRATTDSPQVEVETYMAKCAFDEKLLSGLS